MNIKVNSHTLEIEQNIDINAGEYNITTLNFEFSDEYEGLTKMAVFSNCETIIKTAILNDQCTIPFEVLEEPGQVLLGVYGYEGEDESLELRYSPEPQYFNVKYGSYQNGGDPELPPRSEWEEVVEEINEVIDEANNLNIEAEKEDNETTITITKKDGTTQTVEILDGEQGPPGPPGAVKFLIVNELPTEDIQTDAIYLVPKDDPTQTDLYDEYMYVDNKWELLGEKQITVDLTDYVKFTDYATGSVGGVIKANNSWGVKVSSGYLIGNTFNYSQYSSANEGVLIDKGTLENVITGKGLITNTVNNLTNYYTKTEIDNTVGNIESILETLDIGSGV